MRVVGIALALAMAAAGSLPLSGTVFAEGWPQRTVRVIVPLSAGTPVDVSGRVFAEQLSARWKHPVVVENMAGADGIIAANEFVSRAEDHTLLYSFAGLITINPILHSKLPYDPARDLLPIAATSDNFLAIAVSESLKVGTLAELVAFARSQPGKLNWAATPGLPYFAIAGFQKSAVFEMRYVPYRDFNPAIADLGEGRIDLASTGLTQLLTLQQGGKARLIAVLNRTRSAAAPNLPTAAEAGYPDLTFDGITGFFGWRGMTAEVRQQIADDVRIVAGQQALKEKLAPVGITARAMGPAEFAAAIEEQRSKVAAIALAIGSKPSD